MPSDQIEADEIRKFEQQFAEHPESFVFARLADAYRKSGNPRRALEILEPGLQRHPEYLSARIVHARCLVDLDRPEEAGRAWRRILELDPQNLVALRELAEQARAAGDMPSARSWAERLQHVDPLNEEAARLVSEAGPKGLSAPRPDPAEAEDEIAPAVPGGSDRTAGEEKDASALTHDAGMVTETMADLYVRQGLYEEAASIYWELVKRRPAEPGLRERLAQARALASGDKTADPRDVVQLESAARAAGAGPQVPVPPAVDTTDAAYDHGEVAARSGVDSGGSGAGSESGGAALPASGAGGIRAHLRALIDGRAPTERRVLGPAGEPDDRGASSALRDTNADVSSPGFGDWLRRRR